MAKQWIVERDGKRSTPMSSEKLVALAKAGKVRPNDRICCEGKNNWQPAHKVKGLFPLESSSSSPSTYSLAPSPDQPSVPPPPPPPPPPSPSPPPPPPPPRAAKEVTASAKQPGGYEQVDRVTNVTMAAGGFGLLILALSPLFKWINFGGAGITGISGDGRIVLGVTVLVIIAYVVALLTKKRVTVISLLGVGAWGTVAMCWMAGLIWKVGSVFDSPDVKDNPFAAIFAMQISPGAGLYLGLIGGLITAISLGYLSFQQLHQKSRLWPFYLTQASALLLGVLVASFVGPRQPEGATAQSAEPDSSFSLAADTPLPDHLSQLAIPEDVTDSHTPNRTQPLEVELATLKAYAEKVVLRNVHVGESVLGEQGVFGEIKNTGGRTLEEVELTIFCLDAEGRPVSEDTFYPVRAGSSRWSRRSDIPLRPNYVKRFGYKVTSPSDWSGQVRAEVTNLTFADGSEVSIPARDDPEKRSYIPSIELRDVRVGESTLGETGVFGEVKNTGQKTLTEVEIVIYCLDGAGRSVFEKHYHPVLVSDSSWSMAPDKPLKPNYAKEFGCRIDDAPSDWSGQVEVIIYDLAFAD